METPKISVLVPVYNTEKYLPKCLDSILCQTFKNFEIILVDDGSKDSSGEICNQYAAKYPQIKVYHQNNQGISAVRNRALDLAQGEYIKFIDSDDWVSPNMLEIMYDAAIKNSAEVVRCGLILVEKEEMPINLETRDKEDFMHSALCSNWATVALSLIKTSLIRNNHIRFPANINHGEDYYFLCTSLLNSTNACSLPDMLYFYNRLNEHSTMNNQSLQKAQEQIKSTLLVIEEVKKKGLYNKYKKALLYRKVDAKHHLLHYNPILLLTTFPETNLLYIKAVYEAIVYKIKKIFK